jgi:Flp pilus assembly protein TadD
MDEAARANSQGLAALRAGDAHAAAKYFERACRGDPGAVELRINLATARRVLGDDDAERAVRQGHQVEPDTPDAVNAVVDVDEPRGL